MNYSDNYKALMGTVAGQIVAFEKREQSPAEKNYGASMEKAAIALAGFTAVASFDELISAEKTFQKNDLAVFAKRAATLEAVREGMDDIAEGEASHRQLVENTDAYKKHGYRKKERLPPEFVIPLDAMRRALRGQVKRVENYRANVMGNVQEQNFLSGRIAMLRRAEKLYDAIQREHLLQSE